MIRLLLVRHGQCSNSPDEQFCGKNEALLSDKGLEQVNQLSRYLIREHPDQLFSSPQMRAQQTGKKIAEATGIEMITKDGLQEMDFGEWEGITRIKVQEKYPQEYSLWQQGSWRFKAPGGESQQQVIARASECIASILAHNQNKTIVVVSHKVVIRLLLGTLLEMSLSQSKRITILPASITSLLVYDDYALLEGLNNTDHLS
jgi:broad specificity phosphatase PhoE